MKSRRVKDKPVSTVYIERCSNATHCAMLCSLITSRPYNQLLVMFRRGTAISTRTRMDRSSSAATVTISCNDPSLACLGSAPVTQQLAFVLIISLNTRFLNLHCLPSDCVESSIVVIALICHIPRQVVLLHNCAGQPRLADALQIGRINMRPYNH